MQVNGSQRRDQDRGPTSGSTDSALSPGTWIGRFRIEHELGRGGMGVVYLATDTKLKRSVAIKSLPAAVMNDRDVLSRWEREAQILASLNHPNIATLYELLEQAEDVGYLVLEYVPGQTLAERLRSGQVPQEEVLAIFGQMAEGLEAAHERGVVHRDLKPANVKVTDEGKVKILDFGIAKSTVAKPGAKDSTITLPGSVVGTPAYMSPEQARGAPTDKRTDIWAFGCCLYEALTGRPPFDGPTSTDTVAKILESAPDWNALPYGTPPAIRQLLWRCLQKDPRQRLRDIGEAWFVLSRIQSGSPTTPVKEPPRTETARSPLVRILIVGLVCLLLCGALISSVVIGIFSGPTSLTAPTVSRLVMNEPADYSFFLDSTPHCFLALSPDGSNLVYVGFTDRGTQLCLRPMDSLETRPLPGTEMAHNPFFSPDGQWVGFFAGDELKKVSLAGGEAVTLCDSIPWAGALVGSWAEDGTIIFDSFAPGLQRISADGGVPEILSGPSPWGASPQFPQVLPGGKAILFTAGAQIDVLVLKTNERRTVLGNATCARYVRSGHLIFLRRKTLFAVPFDLKELSVTGSAVPIPDRARLDWAGNMAQMAFSQNGTMAYVPVESDASKRTLVWLDRQGQAELLEAAASSYWLPALSPDGTKVAVTITNESREHQIHIYDLTREALTQLTTEGSNLTPLFSPDSKFVVYSSKRAIRSGLYRRTIDGSDPEELLTQEALLASSFSQDGRFLACTAFDPNTQDDIWILPLEGQRIPRPFVATTAREYMGKFSPDGSWIAYASLESETMHVYLRRFPDGEKRVQVSTEGGFAPLWSPQGGELFYRHGDKVMVVRVISDPELKLSRPEVLFESNHRMGGNYGHEYDISPDGQRFLMVQESAERKNKLVVVQNWFEELKRLAPPEKERQVTP